MKLYFVESATADNYIMAETSFGVLCDNCAPDGRWADIDLSSYNNDGARIDGDAHAAMLLEATDPYLCEGDLDHMGDPCYASMEDFERWNAEQESFNQDKIFLIGEFPRI